MVTPDNRSSHQAGRWWPIPAFLVLAFLLYLLLRPSPPPGESPPPPLPGVHPEKTRTITGVIRGFGSNPHLDVNAIQLKTDKAGILTIDFRPHTAQAIMTYAGTGDSVEVTYHALPDDEVVGYRLERIRNLRSGREAVPDALPPPPDIPPDHNAEYFVIQHPDLILDRYGGIVAIRSGRLLFHFKPGLVDDILPLIKSSGQIGLSAVWRDDHFGFVNINKDKVYIVLSVTIDNKTFLVR